ncbi:hypothetical protein [Natronoflexus pectinivorans]|uniref:hypothetical protein n=1 Tax=Natronoflexus pectinivorans TaxID=682526 RepID=UPI00105289DE|nr:hypothetical protein [Natronoflexus pectinivorans]
MKPHPELKKEEQRDSFTDGFHQLSPISSPSLKRWRIPRNTRPFIPNLRYTKFLYALYQFAVLSVSFCSTVRNFIHCVHSTSCLLSPVSDFRFSFS